MGDVSAFDAFEILNKNNKENILKNFGEYSLGKIRDYFIDSIISKVDVNDESVKEAYNNAVLNGY